MMFTSSAHTPDQDLHGYVNNIRSAEVTGTNLAANGVLLTTCVMTYTGATNVVKLDADDVSVSSVTAADIKNSHIADFTPATDLTRPLIGYVVWDSAMNPNAGTLSVTFDVNGILTITPA